jgi:tRNA dimethylallyltransferase
LLEIKDKTLIIIAGPTAVGKTDLAIEVAKKIKTEIISADSRQFFRELEIGTAKPSTADLTDVTHHFINSLSIKQQYDAAQFGKDAMAVINRLFLEHDTCVMCGGSGLYIKAATDGFDDMPAVDEAIRKNLRAGFEANGLPWLQQEMTAHDPGYFEKIDQHNPHRLIRALEVKLSTGKSLSEFFQKRQSALDFRVLKIGLDLPRDVLYQRIDMRMDQMIGAGLFDEAKELYPYRSHQALQTVGYKEIFDYLSGHYEKDEAIRLLKRNSRRYAKRQMTWFKKDKDFTWFDARDKKKILDFIERSIEEYRA